jgi:phosphatidylethanolamine/phosphatidyl-N-methylethanolamine N-methyltransferase
MPARTAARNIAVYRRWAPVYDALTGRMLAPSRERALALLGLRPGERVVLPGVGTGLDLPLLPPGVSAAGIDISPEMLARARARLPLPGRDIELALADAVQFLRERPGAFDAAVLHLVLSVVPDGRACLHAALAALRPAGRAVVFDKFAPGGPVSAARRAVNLAASRLGTDITRPFGPMLAGSPARVVRDDPALHGLYRIILLQRDK